MINESQSSKNTVLELCKLPDSINVPQITDLLNNYMNSRVSYYC